MTVEEAIEKLVAESRSRSVRQAGLADSVSLAADNTKNNEY